MRLPPYEVLIFSSADVRVGKFRCPVTHPEFRTAGPIEGYTVTFPRTAVWIQHHGAAPFVADPRVVTVYNKGQPYVRAPLAPDGDRDDWFSVSAEMALEVASAVDPRARERPDRPFTVASAPCDPRLYLRQRILLGRIERGELTTLGVESEVAMLLGAVLRAGSIVSRRHQIEKATARRDLVEATKAELARDPAATISLRQLAARVGASPYHLCRSFPIVTGQRLHQYQLDLRIRAALEALDGPGLSWLAHRFGFASHSHFTSVFRRVLGTTPSRARNSLIAREACPA
jgi:AraC family transcriptional regulator